MEGLRVTNERSLASSVVAVVVKHRLEDASGHQISDFSLSKLISKELIFTAKDPRLLIHTEHDIKTYYCFACERHVAEFAYDHVVF